MPLDDSQIEVVKYPTDESLFVTAPPGYGKTHVMMERIKYLISTGFITPPRKVLGLTFSNAAADEMKERISQNVPDSYKYVEIMNFHTLAFRILKTYGHLIGLDRDFKIVDQNKIDDYKYNFLKRNFPKVEYINNLTNEYNKWFCKNHLQNSTYNCEKKEKYIELQQQIEDKFINCANLDYNNLLFKANDLLETCEEVQNLFYQRYKYVLVDEFQDTNYEQYKLLKNITFHRANQKREVFAVGDKKQSIMKFQGANPKNIEAFKEEFDAEEKNLKENHRASSPKIKSIAKKLRDPKYRIDDDIKYELFFNTFVDDKHERIIGKIKELSEEGVSLEDICLMFPIRDMATNIVKKLEDESIDYIFINELKGNMIFKNYSPLFNDLRTLIEDKHNKNTVTNIINRLIKKHYDHSDIILETIRIFSRKFDNPSYYKKDVWERLQEFYNHLSLEVNWKEILKPKIKNKLFLTTIHSAKGLEFKQILIFGIVAYRMPYYTKCFPCNDYHNPEDVDISDAKDLFYVGVSRAINDVTFFYSKQDEKNLSKEPVRVLSNVNSFLSRKNVL